MDRGSGHGEMKERENSTKLGSRNDFQLSEMLIFEIIKCEVWLCVLHFFSSVTGSESPKMF